MRSPLRCQTEADLGIAADLVDIDELEKLDANDNFPLLHSLSQNRAKVNVLYSRAAS